MNLKISLVIMVLLFGFQQSIAQFVEIPTSSSERNSTTNPYSITQLNLSNGLTVYLNEDHTQKDILGAVIVRGGSKLDPPDASGTAHYFEHMMFKGSRQLGTINYEAERPYLDSIQQLYDLLRLDRDNEFFRKRILHKIDSFSVIASSYAIPNEFSKVMGEIGGTGVNAFTTYENIVYHNSFPKQSLVQWIELYRDRFEQPVFRLFQSELETVYEEKNMSNDNFFRKIFEDVYKNFYPKSIYGNRTVLGSIDDLKNPSLSAMESYWKDHYNANNMALVLIGDFNTSEVVDLLEKGFGRWRNGDLAIMPAAQEDEFDGRVEVNRKLAPIPLGILGFRSVAKGHKDEIPLSIIMKLLTNDAQTGLIDTLSISQEIMGAQVFEDQHYDKGGIFIFFAPKPVIQSIDNAEKKVMAQIEKLKNGYIDANLLEAVKISMLKNHSLNMENSRYRLFKIMDSYMTDGQWEDVLDYNRRIKEVSIEDIAFIANRYFGENYLAFHSKMGLPKKERIAKPNITPLNPENKDKESAMAIKIRTMPIAEIEPDYIDFSEDVIASDIRHNLHFFYVKNPLNNIFTLNIRFGIGSLKNPKLQQLAYYMNNIGTEIESFSEYSKQLQLKGISVNYSVNNNYFTISLSGFEDQLHNALSSLNRVLSSPGEDKDLNKKMIRDNKMELRMLKKDVGSKIRMLNEYALFGEQSKYLRRSTKKEIKSINYDEYIALLKEVFQYETYIHYVGVGEENDVKEMIYSSLPFGDKLSKSESPYIRNIPTLGNHKFYYLEDSKAIQSHIRVTVPSKALDENERFMLKPFNSYFGLGMTSLIFREAREYRSLAYGAWGYYSVPYRFDKPGYLQSAISTQADKTNEAVELLINLIDSMPVQEQQILSLQSYLLRSFNAKMPDFRYRSYTVQYWMLQGYKQDPRSEAYLRYKELKIDDIRTFYDNNVLGRYHMVSIVGDSKRFDLEKLKVNSDFKKLKLKDILRY